MTLSLPAALSRPSVSIALALVAGALYPLAFAPYHYWWMLYPVVAGFFLALAASSRPLLTVWCFGLAKYAFGASWIYVSINVYGGASPLLATLLVAIFVSGMALFYLPMGWLFRLLRPGTVLGCVVVFGWGWHLKDWLLGWFLTGFPWLYPGYALTESVMAGLLPLVGVLSAGTLVVLCTLGLPLAWLAWRDMHRQRALVLLGIAVMPLLLGWLANQVNWTQASGSMQVALVQGNIDQATKWNPERRVPNLRVHEELSESHWQEVDLMVWPEAAITMFSQQAGSYLEDLNAQALRSNTDLVTGIPGADVYPDGS